MTPFPRIDPNDVLTQAARETNNYGDEHGLEATLKWLGIDNDPGELMYLAEQRAIRAFAAAGGHNMGFDPFIDEMVAQEIVASIAWKEMSFMVIASIMDGIVIGMRAQQLKDEAKVL